MNFTFCFVGLLYNTDTYTFKKEIKIQLRPVEKGRRKIFSTHQSSKKKVRKQKNKQSGSDSEDNLDFVPADEDNEEEIDQKQNGVPYLDLFLYEKHVLEKKIVREKDLSKAKAQEDSSFLSAVFDLQQVIFLPVSNESAIFYKSRLSTFNFTFYDLATKDCLCFTWDEINSKRGSAEIATCVFKAIEEYSQRGIKIIHLYCDGCYGQNKNSVVASMLLYTLSKFPKIEEICLRFFETNHERMREIRPIVPSVTLYLTPNQLYPVIRFARSKQPYIVNAMDYKDFLDLKTFSKQLRILSIRESESGKNIK
nr:unnamed protein product [Callosobruchus chinensis]